MTDSLLKSSKTTKELEKKIEKFYNKDDGVKFKEWLDSLKDPSIIVNGKIPGLLSSSKITLETTSEIGSYNLILLWIIENKEKFADYDFNGIPRSTFIDIVKDIQKDIGVAKTEKKTFKTEEDVKEWCKNPTINPINGKQMNPMDNSYFDIWKKAFNIMKKKFGKNDIINGIVQVHLPTEHLLFNKKFDFLYHAQLKNENIMPTMARTQFYNQNTNNMQIYMLLSENIDYTEEKNTKLETELELLRNRFTDIDVGIGRANLRIMNSYFRTYMNNVVDNLLYHNFDYETTNLLMMVLGPYEIDGRSKSAVKTFVKFITEEKLSNGEIILEYCEKEKRKSNCPEWIKNMLMLIENYNAFYKDVEELLSQDPEINKEVIDNYENKKFERIKDDPVEKYFKKFEQALALLKQDKYKKFIDPDTFKPVNLSKYLTESQYTAFKKEKYNKDTARKINDDLYKEAVKKYETIKNTNPDARSPSPPKRYTIKLPNKPQPYIEGQALPQFIEDSVARSFKKDYEKSKEALDEYVKVKNMPYLQLVKYVEKKSPSKEIKDIAKDNILFSMTREQINENILNDEYSSDESQLQDRCSSNEDIITKQDFDSEDYPLAKLQLMVRLKIRNGDKYKTECLYGPQFYNYLVESINTKQPFISPATRIPYTEEHIDELMKIMRLINPSIERPYFLKPINDKKLKIEYTPVNPQFSANNFGLDFVSIDLYRQIGVTKHQIYHICVIPINIGSRQDQEHVIGTQSADLTSATMVFRIFKLFRDGRLLNKYVPPYCITYRDNLGRQLKEYIGMMIHFNNYRTVDHWLEYRTRDEVRDMTRDEIRDMFIRYAQEINNFIY
jgi:hypothetical protein